MVSSAWLSYDNLWRMGVQIFIVLLELEKENIETYPIRYWRQKLKGFVDVDNRKRSFLKKELINNIENLFLEGKYYDKFWKYSFFCNIRL